MADYRTPAKAGTALLEALAEEGAATRRTLPREAEKLTALERRGRVIRACALETGSLNALWGAFGLVIAGLVLGLAIGTAAGVLLSLLVGFGGAVALVGMAMRREDRELERQVIAALDTVKTLPFPVDGYPLWLCSEQPLFDVSFVHPVDRALFTRALRGADASVDVEWIDDRIARVTTAPVSHDEMRTGDPALFRKLLDTVLIPLDREAKIARIAMGGLCRRALPPGDQSGRGSIAGTTAT